MSHPVAIRRRVMVAVCAFVAASIGATSWWQCDNEKRVRVIISGQLIRGGWQTPTALRRIIRRERIKTIITLTAINGTDPKYISQAKVVAETGVRWQIVPMHGSRATMEQMAQAADLLADRSLRPVFFHCVAGHHRTSLAHAAYLIRHEGWSATAAWNEVSSLPWARPDALTDQNDQALIYQFSNVQRNLTSQALAASPEVFDDDKVRLAPNREMGRSAARGGHDLARFVRNMESGESQLRPGAARPNLSFRPDARRVTGSRDAR